MITVAPWPLPQSVFSGRLRHFLDIVDPRTLFTSEVRILHVGTLFTSEVFACMQMYISI